MIWSMNETCEDSVLTANSVNANYPVDNILDTRLTKVYRTSSNTTAQVVFYNSTAVTVDSIYIANHNITSGATIKIEGNATDSWSSPSFTETLTYDSDIINGTFTAQSYKYYRIDITDSGNSDGYIEIGRAWLGDSFTPPSIAPAVSVVRKNNSIRSTVISGQSYVDKRYFATLISVQFPKITHTEKANMITQFEYANKPFFIQFDESKSDLDIYYVSLDTDQIAFEILRNPSYYRSSLSFIEEVK